MKRISKTENAIRIYRDYLLNKGFSHGMAMIHAAGAVGWSVERMQTELEKKS